MINGTAAKAISPGRGQMTKLTERGGIVFLVANRKRNPRMPSEQTLNVFSFVKAINQSKEDLFALNPDIHRLYDSFVINRSFSYFHDTIMMANEMNKNHHLDPDLQNAFLLNTIRKRKRFSKWEKPLEMESVEVIKEYFGYSNEKARQVLPLLSVNQINELKKRVCKGGNINNNKQRNTE